MTAVAISRQPSLEFPLDPRVTTRAPNVSELEGVFPYFSPDRALVRRCHRLLGSYRPQPPAYIWWHLARIAKTLSLLKARLGTGQRWLDVSSDAWFWLLARHSFPSWEIIPTSWEPETIEFEGPENQGKYAFQPYQVKIEAETEVLTSPDCQYDTLTAFEVIEHLQFHPG